MNASLPLSKCLDPADFDLLPHELLRVDRYFASEREQHPMRRWEYAMALRAISTWWRTKTLNVTHIVDVGGAGSPFWRMIDEDVKIVDPETSVDLAFYVSREPTLSPIVTCLSVLEHVDDLDRFLFHLSCLVAPGGLLFLTFDYCDGVDDDAYHFHWMRQRIFNEVRVARIIDQLRDFRLLGTDDYRWHGPQVYDYTFASLALIKRP